MDEAFYILEGSGVFVLNHERHPIEKGGSIFIPKNAWHGFENTNRELVLLCGLVEPVLSEPLQIKSGFAFVGDAYGDGGAWDRKGCGTVFGLVAHSRPNAHGF